VIPNAKVHKNVQVDGKREARDRKGRDNKDSGRDEGNGREGTNGTSRSLEKSCYPYVA